MEPVDLTKAAVAKEKKSSKPTKPSYILSIDYDGTYFHADHPDGVNPDLVDARRIAKGLGWDIAIVTHRSHSESLRNIKDAVEPLKRDYPEDWKIHLKQALLITYHKKFHAVNTPMTVVLGKSHAKRETVKLLMAFEESVYNFICSNQNFNDLFREANTFLESQEDFIGKLERSTGTCHLLDKGVQDIATFEQVAKSHFLANGYGKNCPKNVAQARNLVFMTKFFDRFPLENNIAKQSQFESLRHPELVRIVHIDDSRTVTDACAALDRVTAIHYPAHEFVHKDTKAQAQTEFRAALKAVGIDVDDYRKRQVAIKKLEKVASRKIGKNNQRVAELIDYVKDVKHADWEQIAVDIQIQLFDEPKTGKDFDHDFTKGFKRTPRKSGLFWNTLIKLRVELHPVTQPPKQPDESERDLLIPVGKL